MELRNHSEVDVQLALDNIAECHVVREPKLISRLDKFPIPAKISVLLSGVCRIVFNLHSVRSHFHG